GLSQRDIDQAHLFYPPIDPTATSDPELKVGRSEPLNLAPAQQQNFVIKPTATRRYTIQTVGQSDTLIVLFEDQNGDLRFLAGDADGGTAWTARITVRLFRGRGFVPRARLSSTRARGATSVVLSCPPAARGY